MSPSHRRRWSLAVGTLLAGAGLLAVPASTTAVTANQLCYGAGVSGTITGTQGLFVCEPTNFATLCTTPSAGLAPTIGVNAEACVPD